MASLDAQRRAQRAQDVSDTPPARAKCAFDRYDAVDNAHALEAARTWVQAVQGRGGSQAPMWLSLWGGYGTGKTHLLGAAFYALVDDGFAPLYTVAPLLLDSIREGIEDDTYADRFRQVRDCDILILDDLGAESRTKWSEEALFKLLDYRYRLSKPTAVATNLKPSEMESRIASRLRDREMAQVILMRGRDWRLRDTSSGK